MPATRPSSEILASPLPPPPEGDPFTPDQWAIFLAIADTVIASIKPSSEPSTVDERRVPEDEYAGIVSGYRASVTNSVDDAVLERFFGEKLSDVEEFRPFVKRVMMEYVRQDSRRNMSFIFNCLNTRAGSLLLTGYVTPFHLHPVSTRELILQGWATSALPPLRKSYKALTSLCKNFWLKMSPSIEPALGFSRTPELGPSKGFEFDFMQFAPGDAPVELETDVVVVGSGCGGGVAAKNIAEASHGVIVVEKAYYQSPAQFPMKELNAGIHLFENGSLMPSDDGSISVAAGSVWGGGGTVNWSASLQTQGYVRKEWAEQGLKFFETAEFQDCLDRVCDRMGVSTAHIKHNHGNRMLLEGARRLGYHAHDVPQNTGGNRHHDGYCCLGCRSCEKQGPVNSWLPDAARAGAKMIEGLKVEEIVFEDREGVRVAAGVKGKWTSRDAMGGLEGEERVVRDVVIRAKKVVLSAGTLWSPILLLKSGIKNPNIGQNLHLHPATLVYGVYPTEVRPWDGPILTSVVTALEDLDNHGHGVKLECTAMTPSFALTHLPWLPSSLSYKSTVLRYKHTNGFIVIVRDRDAGAVWADPASGAPRIRYAVSDFDRRHAWAGVVALARVVWESGASEVRVAAEGAAAFVRPAAGSRADQDAAFAGWLAGLGAAPTAAAAALTFASAHQMGTCRMGTSPRGSVVDPRGRVWGVEGLAVCDASVFPSASGVNPMVTNMAVAEWVSRGVVGELEEEEEVKAKLEGGRGAKL
ncbi:hypothetical protein FGG08_004853 [Glutinoglossum americanum]|uniref:Long-chain-alcohol oxidase n=1 Tax=Glutinoglossum americanum TaxID=1670608 RepID=A0A9P8I4T7_9PEZI|nr:hypothetical protein FGG08_004853 [Glutinoglossum americanum]